MKTLKHLFIIFAIFSSLPVVSQTKQLDSLLRELKKPLTETKKARLFNAIASACEDYPVMRQKYVKEAMKIARKKGLKHELANSWQIIGNANIKLGNYAEALECFFNAQMLYEALLKSDKNNNSAKTGLGSLYGSIANAWAEQNDYAKGLEYNFKALKLFEETGHQFVLSAVYNNIGIIYSTQKEYDRALEYLNKALFVQKKINDPATALTISNIGNMYLAKNEDEKALRFFNRAEKQFEKFTDVRGQAELFNNFGNYYEKKDNRAKAIEYYKKALALFEKAGEKYGASASLAFLGNMYAMEGNMTDAIKYLKQSSVFAEEIGVLVQVKESEKALSDIYEKTGYLSEALKHYKKYIAAKDKIINSENIRNMVREEMNYEFERKEALRKVENDKRQALFDEEAKRHTQQMLFAGLSALLLLSIAFLIYNKQQLKKRLTLQRDLAEYEQKALHLQMNPHFVFNCLGSISSFIVQNGTDQAIKYLAKFSKLMRLTLEYSKESLIPIDKEIEGLQNYLELEQLRFNQLFDFTITKDPTIEDDMAIPPLLLQPFVENAIIHGIAPKKGNGAISIDFRLSGDKMVCMVIDNGIGINKSKRLKETSVTVHNSMAMEITKKRLEVIQAFTSKISQVKIKELIGTTGEPLGTQIVLNLPIQYATN